MPDKPITPILELEIPRPRRGSQIGSHLFGFIAGLMSTLAFFGTFRKSELPFHYLVLLFIVTIFLAILVHELGHLLAGRVVGLRFSALRVAWFSLGFEYGKLTVHFHRDMPLAGFASIRIDRIRRL